MRLRDKMLLACCLTILPCAAPQAHAVDCSKTVCPSDAEVLSPFFHWMRRKKYPECIISRYQQYTEDAEGLLILKQNLLERGNSRIASPITISYYDIVPTNPEASFHTMGPGGGDTCDPSLYWSCYSPNDCPTPRTIDLAVLKSFFERTFGLSVNFAYNRYEIDYVQVFGQPALNEAGTRYEFPRRFDALRVNRIRPDLTFDPHALVSFAIDSWKGIKVIPSAHHQSGGDGGYANVGGDYSIASCMPQHEWAHSWGLGHQYHWDESQPAVRRPLSLPGLMSGDIYAADMCPTDAVERYVFEPVNAPFLDEDRFPAEYAENVKAGNRCFGEGMPQCGRVALRFGRMRARRIDGGRLLIQSKLRNRGTIRGVYLDAVLKAGRRQAALQEIIKLETGAEAALAFTIPCTRARLRLETDVAGVPAQILARRGRRC